MVYVALVKASIFFIMDILLNIPIRILVATKTSSSTTKTGAKFRISQITKSQVRYDLMKIQVKPTAVTESEEIKM